MSGPRLRGTWGESNRGEQAVLDRHTGAVRALDLRWADDVARLANAFEGTEPWLGVPAFELDF